MLPLSRGLTPFVCHCCAWIASCLMLFNRILLFIKKEPGVTPIGVLIVGSGCFQIENQLDALEEENKHICLNLRHRLCFICFA